MSNQERYHAHTEVAALLAEKEWQWRGGAALLGLGMAEDNGRRVKRWKISPRRLRWSGCWAAA
jgi:hypothetical protein